MDEEKFYCSRLEEIEDMMAFFGYVPTVPEAEAAESPKEEPQQ